MRAVAALAVDADANLVGAGQNSAVANADGARVQLGRDMQRGHRVDLIEINLRVVQKQLRALENLLRRLDEEVDRAGELILHLAQNLGGAHVDGAVDVVPAGVHHAGHFAAGRHILRFLNGQRVDVAAENDRGAVSGLCAFQLKEEAGFADPLEAVILDVLLDVIFQQRTGVVLVHAQFGVFVDIFADSGDFRRDFRDFLSDVYHNIIPRLSG